MHGTNFGSEDRHYHACGGCDRKRCQLDSAGRRWRRRAIHRAAGPELYKECAKLSGCATGKAKLTRGYKLPAKYMIHTVGPVWSGGERGEPELLANCYRSVFKVAREHGVRSIAIPASVAEYIDFQSTER